jgi:hypothetical protein
MKSQTLSTLVVSKSLQILFSFLLLVFSAATVDAQTFFTDWTTPGSSFIHNFVLPDGTTGTVTKTETTCAVSFAASVQSLAHNAIPNYPSTFFLPTPPNPGEFLVDGANRNSAVSGCASATAVVSNLVINFSEPVANIRFHFVNLDAGTYRFFDSAMTPINVTRLSGNDDLEVAGNAVNATPLAATGTNCDTVPNTAQTGGCGSVAVPGKYTQLRITTTDSEPAAGSGDGHWWTMSLHADYGDAPAIYDNNGVNEASHDLLAANLRLGATVDADSAEKSGATALGDDTTGSDDEDGVAAFDSYVPAGGQVCTGTLGTYTTQPLEYCAVISVTNTGAAAGQVVGWLDAGIDGDFLDVNDRTTPLNHPAVDDGTFTTGNVPAGVTTNVILVWTGLPSTLPATYFRFRVTRDPAFFSDPQPLGAAIDGEAEDYAVLVPSAANVSISGRVLTTDGRGISNARITLTDLQGNPRTVTTNPFGYYRIAEVPVGETYVLAASAKRYQFDSQVVSVKDNIIDLDFVAQE